ncbi:MAG: helicase-associated domain-containing protein [Sandaracinaceae bacterium]
MVVKRSASSTDRPIPLAVDPRAVEGLAGAVGDLGYPSYDAYLRRVEDVEASLEALRRAPPLSLAVLEVLVERSGMVAASEVAATLEDRLGAPGLAVEKATTWLVMEGLALQVTTLSPDGRGQQNCVRLLKPNAAAIVPLVDGVSLPAVRLSPASLEPANETSGDPPSDDELAERMRRRDLVVRLASCVHARVKANRSGVANRTSLKRLAPQIGIGALELEELFDRAVSAGVLVTSRAELVTPSVDALRRIARGELVLDDELDATRARGALAATPDWIAVEALVRAATRTEAWPAFAYYAPTPHEDEQEARSEIGAMTGVVRATHDGAEYVRLRRLGDPRTGDGHVTPSFEVMLGPAADPELAVVLALAAEPVRIDRVVTLKLTPQSVAAASTKGIGEDAILDALARVGRHALADNVTHSVRDWARRTRTMEVRRVWAVELSAPDVAETAASTLGARVIARPSPTLLLVEGDERSDPTARLLKAGIAERSSGDELAPERGYEEPPAPMDLDSLPKPDPELARRLAEARRTNIEAGLEQLVRRGPPDAGEASSPIERLEALTESRSPSTATLARVTLTLWKDAWPAFEKWCAGLDPVSARTAREIATASPLSFGAWLTLRRPLRSRALEASHSFDALIERSVNLSTKQKPTPAGRALVRALERAAPADLAELGLELDADDSDFDFDELLEEVEALEAGGRALERPGRAAPRMPDVQGPREVERAFRNAAERERPVWLRVRSKAQGDRTVQMLPERILVRGNDVALLGRDLENDQSLSFPLANIVSIVVIDA